MYKTIVLALDGSEGAADALPHAVNLARRDAATLVIAHARTHALETSQEAMLEQTVEGLRSGGIDAVLEIRTSLVEEVASFLGDVATEANADLIVIAGRGRSALAGAVLGSVTRGYCMWRHAPYWSCRCTRMSQPERRASRLPAVPRAEPAGAPGPPFSVMRDAAFAPGSVIEEDHGPQRSSGGVSDECDPARL